MEIEKIVIVKGKEKAMPNARQVSGQWVGGREGGGRMTEQIKSKILDSTQYMYVKREDNRNT